MTLPDLSSFRITPETELERRIISSQEFERSFVHETFGEGHLERFNGVHVWQIIRFIDEQQYPYWRENRERLRLLGLLHDIGKPLVRYENGQIIGSGHSLLSMEIAQQFIVDPTLLEIIRVHNKSLHLWKDAQRGRYKPEKLRRIYDGKDVPLLVRFMYADGNNRDRSDVKWSDEQAAALGFYPEPVYLSEPGVLQ